VELLKAFDGLSSGDDNSLEESSSGVSMSGDGTSLSDSGDESSSAGGLLFDRHLVELLKAFDGLSGNDDDSNEDDSGEEDSGVSLEDSEESLEESPEDDSDEDSEEDSSSDETGGGTPDAGGEPTPGTACDIMYYTAADVATHNTADDCHVILYDVVYDLTAWVTLHPGGPDKITAMCGSDGTAAYVAKHGSPNNVNTYGSSYKLGRLGLTSGIQSGPCL
jgi:cytochrome b involved in lipid metabolism